MFYTTGTTIIEAFLSVDGYNNPVVPASFSSFLLKNGEIYTGVSLSFNLINADSGLYQYDFTPTEFGNYQVYVSNNNVSLLYISNVFKIEESPETSIYVGL